jgi:hypothetical protein
VSERESRCPHGFLQSVAPCPHGCGTAEPCPQDGLQAARYIVARYIRSGFKGAALRARVERHARMLRGTEPELAEALETVGIGEVRRLVDSTLAARRDHQWRPSPRVSVAEHQSQVIAGICAAEEA